MSTKSYSYAGKTISLNLEGHDFTISADDNGKFDLNNLRLQVVDFIENSKTANLQFKNVDSRSANLHFGNTLNMAQWTRSVSEGAKAFYEIETFRGGVNRGKTLSNEKGVYAYASWLNEDFGFAVISAFEALANGDVSGAEKFVRERVTVVREHLRSHDSVINDKITQASNDGNIRGTSTQCIINLKRLVCNKVFGVSPSQFKKEHDGLSPRDFMEKDLDLLGLTEYSRMISRMEMMVELGFSYDAIKEAL